MKKPLLLALLFSLLAACAASGGAIFHKGELVGILVAVETAPPFRNYFTPIARLYEILPVPVLSASARSR